MLYTPDSQAYEHFYLSQVGGNGVFDGKLPHLQGYGLGGILGKVFKFAIPIVKKGLRFLAPHAARVGSQVLSDVSGGENIGRSLKQRGSQAITNISQQLLSNGQSGNGWKRKAAMPQLRRKKAIKLPPKKVHSNCKTRLPRGGRLAVHHDIFGKY